MPIFDLDNDLLFEICSNLAIADILSLRQTCSFLRDTTKAKSIWVQKLRNLSNAYPANRSPTELSSHDVECMARRIFKLAFKIGRGEMGNLGFSGVLLPHSITWLRLVDARWLFVAFSDESASKLALWDLRWMSEGHPGPIADASLPGRVQTGQVEAQDDGVVIALALDTMEPCLLIINLQPTHDQDDNEYAFHQLARIEGSAHILMLCGQFVGCAILHERNVLHLISWRDGRILELPSPPGDLETPERRSVPHLMAICKETLVVIRFKGIEIYRVSGTSVIFSRCVPTPIIHEVVVRPFATGNGVLRLLLFTPAGLETLELDDCLLGSPETASGRTNLICSIPPDTHVSAGPSLFPWFRLVCGAAGDQCLWVETVEASEPGHDGVSNNPAYIVILRLDRPELSDATPIRLPLQGDLAFSALPRLDFDDTFGVVVMGNCFGEMAMYDLDAGSDTCFHLARDITWRPAAELPRLAPTSTNLPIPPIIGPRRGMSPSEAATATVTWSRDDLNLNNCWSTAWEEDYHYRGKPDRWHGVPCDLAWRLTHVYSIPGTVIPQAFFSPEYDNDDRPGWQPVIFRVGTNYFYKDEHNEFWLWSPHGSGGAGEKLPRPRLTALTEHNAYRRALQRDHLTRNRWLEMIGRGGDVDWDRLLRRNY
ncbi:F-box domain-containing protein [Mycena kentingensis (nom. inval.)]|nr:F-box domain-containing protein [Mycena kentingensis (nom. inval.)]